MEIEFNYFYKFIIKNIFYDNLKNVVFHIKMDLKIYKMTQFH